MATRVFGLFSIEELQDKIVFDKDMTCNKDLVVLQDLLVTGTTTSINSEIVNIKDNYLYLNKDYTLAASKSGGFMVNIQPEIGTINVVTGATFTVGVLNTTDPTVNLVNTFTYSSGDIIQISENVFYDGIYEVAAHSGGVLSVKGIGANSSDVDFAQEDFVANTDQDFTVVRLKLAVFQVSMDGKPSFAFGDKANDFTFKNMTIAASSLVTGSVLFSDVNGHISQNNTKLFWDNTNDRLGIGTTVPGGPLHIHTATAGGIPASSSANALIIEDSNNSGMSILMTDTNTGRIVFGSLSDNFGASIGWVYSSSDFHAGPSKTGANFRLLSDQEVTNLTLSGSSGNQLATFAKDVTVSGNLGVGTSSPVTNLEVVGPVGGTVGGFASGHMHIRGDGTVVNSNAVITGHSSFNGNTQLWYLGSVSSSNNNIAIINRQTGSIAFHTAGVVQVLIEDDGDVVFEKQVRIKGGAPALNKVLTSDAVGIATWEVASAGGWTDDGTVVRLTTSTDVVKLNILASISGDLDVTTASGGVFKFTDNAFQSGQDSSNYLEIGHGGSNSFVNSVGAGNMDFRFDGTNKATFTSFGHLHLLTDVDQKHNLKIKTANNANDSGIAWENSGGNFSQTIFRTDVGSNNSDLVFAIGSNADIDLLTESVRIHGSVAELGKFEIVGDFQIVSGTPGLNKVLTSDASGNAVWAGGPVTGQFSHAVSQKPGVTTPVSLNFDTNDITLKGISHSTTVQNEEFTATLAKAFTFMLAPQWERTSSGGTRIIDFFMQLSTDGGTVFTDIDNSNVKVVAGANDSNVIPLMATVDMAVNDIVRFQMRVSTTADGLGTVFTAAETGPPTIPATPAQILTIFSGD